MKNARRLTTKRKAAKHEVSRYSPGRSCLLREEKIKFGLSEPVGRAEARIKLFFSRRGSTADKTVPWPTTSQNIRDLIASQKSHRTAKKIHLAHGGESRATGKGEKRFYFSRSHARFSFTRRRTARRNPSRCLSTFHVFSRGGEFAPHRVASAAINSIMNASLLSTRCL